MKFATCTARRRTLDGLQECNGHNSYIVAFHELNSLTSVFFSKDQVATGAFLDIDVHHNFKVQVFNFDTIYLWNYSDFVRHRKTFKSSFLSAMFMLSYS